jgi:hypothetical protein
MRRLYTWWYRLLLYELYFSAHTWKFSIVKYVTFNEECTLCKTPALVNVRLKFLHCLCVCVYVQYCTVQ